MYRGAQKLLQHCLFFLALFCTTNQQTHNYFTNYHTATCFDTIVPSSGSLQSIPCQVTPVFQMQLSVIQFTIKFSHIGFVQVLILCKFSYHTYLLTPWCRVLLEKLTGLQLVKQLPAFHGTRRFITALTSVRHLSLSWASPIQSIHPHPTSWRSILILSTHLRLGLPRCLIPSGFPTKTLYTPLSSPIRATCPCISWYN